MKKQKRPIALLLALALLCLALAACAKDAQDPTVHDPNAQDSNEQTAPPSSSDNNDTQADNKPANPQTGTTEADSSFVRKTEDGTLTIGTSGSILGFNPVVNTTSMGLGMVFDTLIAMDPETRELIPWLAESWEWSEDYLTCTFHLRDDVYFTDGTQLTAHDVYYCLSTLANSSSMISANFSKIDFERSSCPDDFTFVMEMNTVDAQTMYSLSFPCAGIYPEAWAQTVTDEQWWDSPVGSGPYICVENVDGSHTKYIANENYWNGAPEATTLTVKSFADSTAMFIAYESGELDAAMSILSADAQRIINGDVPNTTYQIAPTFNFEVLALCDYVDVFQDIRVRQAIAHAIDRQGCIDASYGILATPMDSCIGSYSSYYMPTGSYEYDPEKARELLAEAGYSDGDIVLRLITFNTTVKQQLAEAVQAYLAAVGIVVNVETYVQPTAIPMLRDCEADITLLGASNAFDASMTFEKYDTNGTDPTGMIHDDVLQALIVAGYSTMDSEERASIYTEAQQLMFDQCYNVPILNINACYCYRTYIEDFPCVTPDRFNPWYCHFAA